MKIVVRILIILAVFALVMGVTYGIVNARSSSAPFGPGNERFSRSDGAPLAFPGGQRPEFPGRERGEFHGERGGGGWFMGTLKNIVIIGFIVALIVVPKAWIQKRRRTVQIAAG
jgi:hypothetical protein